MVVVEQEGGKRRTIAPNIGTQLNDMRKKDQRDEKYFSESMSFAMWKEMKSLGCQVT
jgi:hypothetical protein